jgi:hypothetical protein
MTRRVGYVTTVTVVGSVNAVALVKSVVVVAGGPCIARVIVIASVVAAF